jgi:hypothetical protein
VQNDLAKYANRRRIKIRQTRIATDRHAATEITQKKQGELRFKRRTAGSSDILVRQLGLPPA